jgi:hypothetical protein
MDAPTIQKIVELAAPTKFELDGLLTQTSALRLSNLQWPRPSVSARWMDL